MSKAVLHMEIEMPENCDKCPFSVNWVLAGEDVIDCAPMGKTMYHDGPITFRQPWCPLKEVKQDGGRK